MGINAHVLAPVSMSVGHNNIIVHINIVNIKANPAPIVQQPSKASKRRLH